ncbi:MAG: BNR repeat-containing protein, partial [Paludibacter sp.]|nr:BNR repeat-containing protein [Paludibacter sp.]
PQNSELINQTSITADKHGNPYIATYYRDENSDVPQYRVIYLDKKENWQNIALNFRKTAFSLSGTGTKKIPISRPQILFYNKFLSKKIFLIFRDEERGYRASMAVCSNLKKNKWKITDITDYSLGDWEPTYDTELWKTKKRLHLFLQETNQGDGEQNTNTEAQPITVKAVKH